ncbi:hypothetical protein QCA50_020428 [Cerrena zonata]|uniref:Uncharacterized protein n=1 Tax=Cerrena zonata TaxID=2478898 RepID=A0AAW0FES1_9APHY
MTLISFSKFRKQSGLPVPGSPSSTELWYFTHDPGNLCIHPPILCNDQQGILYIRKWTEKLLRIIYAITTCISSDRAKERLLFWTLSALPIILATILRPLSPVAIIGVLLLHSYGRIQRVLDPSGVIHSRYLLEVTEMESKVLECEMDRLYSETRKALAERYTKLDPLLST